jgi:hypothetical protein
MNSFNFVVHTGEIQAFVKPGVMVGAAIGDAKKLSNDHYGCTVRFKLNGVPMSIHGDTSETNAYWNYMRSLDEAIS